MTKEQAVAFLAAAVAPATARARTILLYSKDHQPTEDLRPTFADRNAWKASRQFR